MTASIAHRSVPSSSTSWFALAVSCCALCLLLGWSALNTSKLLKGSLFSFTGPAHTAAPVDQTAVALPAVDHSQIPPGQANKTARNDKIERVVPPESEQMDPPNGAKEVQQGANSPNEAHLAAETQLPSETHLTQANPSVNHATVSEPAAGVESSIAQKVESAFAKMRREELAQLENLAHDITFEPASSTFQQEASTSLDKIFELLFLYAESNVDISVASSELNSVVENEVLSVERAKAIVAYLVDRGVDFGRFSIQTRSGTELPNGSHRVYISADAVSK